MPTFKEDSNLNRVAFLGNYSPRRCGIATFTTDLVEATAARFPNTDCMVLAMNDVAKGYDYPSRVRFELLEKDESTYRQAAAFLNQQEVDLVSLQHEYGIFGGPAGSHILSFLRELKMPVVTTLHTILRNPDPDQQQVMDELISLSDRLIVMSQRGAVYLKERHGVRDNQIDLIPHGIPNVPFADSSFHKDKFGVEGKQVLLTFGLLSPNKGLDHVINALPSIVEKHPDVIYIILGSTHPHVIQEEGERYRESLKDLAAKLGVSEHVKFVDKFVTLEELVEYISAADIYITPYNSPNQITSGTLAYTIGAGKPVISTPYWYAEELLAEGRGLLVPFRDPDAIAGQVNFLLDNDSERQAIRKRAYLYGRKMIWPEVADGYMESFRRARREHMDEWGRARRAMLSLNRIEPSRLGSERWPKEKEDHKMVVAPLVFDHLLRLTDETGMVQHSSYTVPNLHEGYSTDDNARALIVSTAIEENGLQLPPHAPDLSARYLAFLKYAFNKDNGRFRNQLPYNRTWEETMGSEDSHGRALWSLGVVLSHSCRDGLLGMAYRLFEQALPAAMEFNSPRAQAFTLLGIHEYLGMFPGDRLVSSLRRKMVTHLMDIYHANSSSDWCWFEDELTYSNPILPRALLVSGQDMEWLEPIKIGLESLEWLIRLQQTPEGHFAFVGSNGFFKRKGFKAAYDQQPVEAYNTVAACLAAHSITGWAEWPDWANLAFRWFYGDNDLGLALYDPATGGCQDGLQVDRVNRNQGAESTLAYLLSVFEFINYHRRVQAAHDQESKEHAWEELRLERGGD